VRSGISGSGGILNAIDQNGGHWSSYGWRWLITCGLIDPGESARIGVGPRPQRQLVGAWRNWRKASEKIDLRCGVDLRRFVLHSFVAKQAITMIFLVEPTNVGWSVRIGDEPLGSFSTQRQALDDVKNRRAMLTAKGQRSTVVVTKHGSEPTKR
jgi:hypothetical protein